MPIPYFTADSARVTILRPLASSAFGSYTLTLPEGIDLEDVHDFEAPGNELGYVATLTRARRVGGLARRFVRADVAVTAADPSDLDVFPESSVDAVLEDAATRVSSDFFLESDITKAGLGPWVPFVDFKVGDKARVNIWGHVVTLPITRIEPIISDHDVVDWLVHLGGQLVSDDDAREVENENLRKAFLQDRRELAGIEGQVKIVDKKAEDAKSTAETAQGTAEDAKQIAEQSKEASDAALTDTRIEYAVGTSEEFPPVSGWSTATPQRPSAAFIWMRTWITYGSGQSEVTSPVLVTGNTGAPGADGETSYFHTAYANSADGVAGFSTTDPTGRTYVGTYSDFVEADSTDPARYSWALIKGADGVSVTEVDVFFRQVNKGAAAPSVPTTATPTGWSATEPAWARDKDLYQITRVRYSTGAFAYTPPSKVGAYDAANAAWAAATDADGELQKKVKAAQDAQEAAEGAFEDVDDLINAPEGEFRQGVAAAFWAQDQVNDEQSEFNQAVSQTATNALATSRLAFPHVSITPADASGRPYWSYGASSSTLTPDNSSVNGEASTYSWRHTGAIPGSTVAEAYFDVTPGIDLKLNLMTYMSSGSTSGIYVGFVDETGANAVEQWKDLSTSGGAWIESAEMGFPAVVGTWTPGVGIFRLKPGVKKARPVVRTLTAITVWGMHLAAWFPLAEDLQAETDARLDALEELRGVSTEVTRLGERIAELESGEDWRHLGTRRGRLIRDEGYINISWPSDKRATFTWVAGENLDVTFRVNYENNTSIEDSFNTVEDFLGQWSMSLGSDSGNTNIRSASANYRRRPGVVVRDGQTAPRQSIPHGTWFRPGNATYDGGGTGLMGWTIGSKPSRVVATLTVGWDAATAGRSYGVGWYLNGVRVEELVETGLGPRWPWENGYRQQTVEFSGTLQPGDVLIPRMMSTSGQAGDAESPQRRITHGRAELFTIT